MSQKNLQRRKGNTKSSAYDDMQRRNDQSSSQESRGRNIAAIVPDRLGSGPSRSTEKKRMATRRTLAAMPRSGAQISSGASSRHLRSPLAMGEQRTAGSW